MEEHKLPHTPYPSSLELREHIVAIYNVIKDLQKETGLLYPTKNHFTSTIPKLGQNQGRGRQSSQAIFRSEEHTSELQSHSDLVCRLLLDKKKSRNHLSSPPKPQKSELAEKSTIQAATERIVQQSV